MLLDTRTLLAVLLVAGLLMAAILWVGSAGQFRDGLGKWTASLLVQALAWGLLAMRDTAPPLLSIAVAHAALVLGWSLQAGAIFDFQRRRLPPVILWAPPIAVLMLTAAALDQPQIRLVFGAYAYAIGEALLALIVLSRAGGAGAYIRWLLSATYWLMAGVNLSRGAVAMLDMHRLQPLFEPGALQTLTLVSALASVIVASFAFLLMHMERAEEEIRRLATTDPLTGVYNRRTFMDLARRELARGRRSNQPVSLVILDLDWFKRVNDTYGHLVGDRVLVEFARLVQRCLRREDLLVRYGGEEFCLLLPGTSATEAKRTAERIRELVEQTAIDIGDGSLRITVSCGITTVPPDREVALDAALAAADDALYQAKQAGRNRSHSLAPRAAAVAG